MAPLYNWLNITISCRTFCWRFWCMPKTNRTSLIFFYHDQMFLSKCACIRPSIGSLPRCGVQGRACIYIYNAVCIIVLSSVFLEIRSAASTPAHFDGLLPICRNRLFLQKRPTMSDGCNRRHCSSCFLRAPPMTMRPAGCMYGPTCSNLLLKTGNIFSPLRWKAASAWATLQQKMNKKRQSAGDSPPWIWFGM